MNHNRFLVRPERTFADELDILHTLHTDPFFFRTAVTPVFGGVEILKVFDAVCVFGLEDVARNETLELVDGFASDNRAVEAEADVFEVDLVEVERYLGAVDRLGFLFRLVELVRHQDIVDALVLLVVEGDGRMTVDRVLRQVFNLDKLRIVDAASRYLEIVAFPADGTDNLDVASAVVVEYGLRVFLVGDELDVTEAGLEKAVERDLKMLVDFLVGGEAVHKISERVKFEHQI